MSSQTLRLTEKDQNVLRAIEVDDAGDGKIDIMINGEGICLDPYQSIDLAIFLNNLSYPHTIRHRIAARQEKNGLDNGS